MTFKPKTIKDYQIVTIQATCPHCGSGEMTAPDTGSYNIHVNEWSTPDAVFTCGDCGCESRLPKKLGGK